MRTRKSIGNIGYAEAQIGPDHWVRVGDRLLPKQIHVVLPGAGGQPRLTARLEVVEGIPQCREITIASVENGREVKQNDLRTVSIAEMVEGIYAGFSEKIEREENGVIMAVASSGEIAYVDAMHDIAAARKGRGARKITPTFLAEVADVYRANVNENPTQAVRRTYDVSTSMAAEYVRRARKAGLLPATTSGKKQA
ncbi:hypothetical protein [Nonomuraea cavernae]|uniref:Uncharacterized protein n=1 Tax=Nonomuraea cavernae TaxID=2045107 RepID=A0A918DKC2_9ACTN|nr:hypothetical protein [Nonomuraea cavernae]MCA2187728.1 hypothetical protein [Nonomuraea cavernae]GGO70682.1 hypothetical protein GCM10012289_34650 [Nonomuraea cavernae]